MNTAMEIAMPIPPAMQRNEGSWILEYDGQRFALEDTPGLRYLAYLLHHPREQTSALVLEKLVRTHTHLRNLERTTIHDARERARHNVARAVTEALAQIAMQQAALADYLAASVRLGVFCVYDPDRWVDDR